MKRFLIILGAVLALSVPTLGAGGGGEGENGKEAPVQKEAQAPIQKGAPAEAAQAPAVDGKQPDIVIQTDPSSLTGIALKYGLPALGVLLAAVAGLWWNSRRKKSGKKTAKE